MHTNKLSHEVYLAMLFVTLLLTANIIGEKPVQLGAWGLPAGLLIFPLTYLLGDLITELYGFLVARRIIWFGLISNLILALCCRLAIILPATQGWDHQEAYAQVLGQGSRLMCISVVTYFVGELFNAFLMSSLKVRWQGRRFTLRALLASMLGEGLETLLFVPWAFAGLEWSQRLTLMGHYYVFKVLYAALTLPLLKACLSRLTSSVAKPVARF